MSIRSRILAHCEGVGLWRRPLNSGTESPRDTPNPGSRDVWARLKAPYSGPIVLDRKRAQRHLFAAIDLGRSLSERLATESLSSHHIYLAQLTKALVKTYEHRDPEFDELRVGCDIEQDDARILVRYLCQLFSTTEPFTGRSGEYVTHDQLLA